MTKYMKIPELKNFIIIAGPTCSGKTTLANEIKETIFPDKSSIIPQDAYYKDWMDIPRIKNGYLLDSINAFNTRDYLWDIERLISHGYADIPVYDVESNRRISRDQRVDKKEILILEGLHTLSILEDYKRAERIYIDTDLETCLKRRIERDKKYGISEEATRKYFKEVIIPMYEFYIKPQKEIANFIIKKDGDKECLLRKLANY